MAGNTAEGPIVANDPTIASTRDYGMQHLRSQGRGVTSYLSVVSARSPLGGGHSRPYPSAVVREDVARRILGIVGGTGPESTVDYYRSVIAAWTRHRSDGTFPRIIINSIEGGGLWRLLEAGDHPAVVAEIGDAVDRLSAAGAGLVILASNTLHTVFDEVARRAPVPMLSIVTETVEAVVRMRLERPAVLGTRFVMESDLYLEPLRRAGCSAVVPNPIERSFLHDRYGEELIVGKFSRKTRAEAIAIIGEMKQRARIDGVILAGTELGLLLPEGSYHGVPVVDSAKAHVGAAVRWLLGDWSVR